MATVVMMKHPENGLVKKGFFGFSWTTFFWGGWPAIFRGDIAVGVFVIILQFCTLGLGAILWAFFYNKRYTQKLLERGYRFADSEGLVTLAKSKLGVAV